MSSINNRQEQNRGPTTSTNTDPELRLPHIGYNTNNDLSTDQRPLLTGRHQPSSLHSLASSPSSSTSTNPSPLLFSSDWDGGLEAEDFWNAVNQHLHLSSNNISRKSNNPQDDSPLPSPSSADGDSTLTMLKDFYL